MNLRQSIEALTDKVNREQLCASEIHCLLLETLKCPDLIQHVVTEFSDDINDRIADDWTDSPHI